MRCNPLEVLRGPRVSKRPHNCVSQGCGKDSLCGFSTILLGLLTENSIAQGHVWHPIASREGLSLVDSSGPHDKIVMHKTTRGPGR